MTRYTSLFLLFGLTSVACGGDDPPGENSKADGGAGGQATGGSTGTEVDTGVKVEFRITGDGTDSNGFLLKTDGGEWVRYAESSVVLDLAAGDHDFELTDVRSNCTLAGASERSVKVTSGSVASLVWDVTCENQSSCAVSQLFENELPSDQALKVLLVPVDYSDAAASVGTQELVDIIDPWMSDKVDEFSVGRASVTLEHDIQEWLRLSGPTADYADGDSILEEAVALAAQKVDLSLYDAVFVAPPTEAREKIGWAWASAWAPGEGIQVGDVEVTHAVHLGPDIWYSSAGPNHGAYIATHEFLHLLGLPDLYDVPGYYARNAVDYVGNWDIMGEGRRLMSYQRMQLNWFDVQDTDCVASSERTVAQVLHPVSGEGAVRSLMIRTSPTTALVAEMIGPESVAEGCKTGVLIYRVNGSFNVGYDRPEIYVERAAAEDPAQSDTCRDLHNALFDEDTPTFTDYISGVTLTLKEKLEDGYLIETSFGTPDALWCENTRYCAVDAFCDSGEQQCVDTEGLVQLKAQVNGTTMCLHTNSPNDYDVHGGAAYMGDCLPSDQNMWTKSDAGGGKVLLKSAISGDCMEGNESGGMSFGGAAFLYTCSGAGGQEWELVADGSDYRLKTTFQGPDKCLEANAPSNTSLHSGAVYMADCLVSDAQLWDVVTF